MTAAPELTRAGVIGSRGEHSLQPYHIAEEHMTTVLVLLVFASWIFWLSSVLCARKLFAPPRTIRTPQRPTRPVSIIKPVRGLDFEARENFISHCEQAYPDYEVLFGVASADDPAVPVILELQRRYGFERVQLVIAPNDAPNPKAGLLDALARRARHDLIVLTDSDVRLPPDGVARAVEPLADPAVGLVTLLYRGGRAESPAAVMEALGMEAEFMPQSLVARRVMRTSFALGPGNAIRRDALDRIGSFSAVARYLADDYQLGYQVGAKGYKVEVGRVVISAVIGRTTLKTWSTREARWARTIRMSRPAHYPGLLVTFATPLALVAAFATGWWSLLAGSLAVRWYVGWKMTQWMDDRAIARWLWLLPVRDLCSPMFWIAGMFGKHVTWRGRTFRVVDGVLRERDREEGAAWMTS